MKYYRLLSCLLTALSAMPFICGAETIRFEADDVLVSPVKLPVNKLSNSQWDIWSTDVNNSWSGKKTLRSGEVKKDIIPGKSSRELVFSIPVKKSGLYSLSCRAVRNVGFSLDNGKSWIKACNDTSLIQAKKFNAGDKISVRASACYTTPQNRGSIYIDYFELHLLPLPALSNPELLEKADNRGIPDGWSIYSSVDNQTGITHLPGKVQIHFGKQGGFWIFSNNAELYGSPGDHFRVRAKIKNIGQAQTTIVLQYTGQVNRKIVNHAVDQNVVRLAPGVSEDCAATVTIPAGIESLRFRFTGSTPDTKIEVSDIKFEYLGNVIDSAERINFSFLKQNKLNWTADNAVLTVNPDGSTLKVTSVPGKKWTIRSLDKRPAIRGEGIEVKYSLQSLSSDAKVRVRVKSFSGGEQAQMALNNGEWNCISGKKSAYSVQAYTPTSQCDTLALEFDGYGDITLGGIAVKRITETKYEKRQIRKVPVPSYPAHKAVPGRGLIVRPMADGRHYLSWRLNSQDPGDIAFDVFSCVNGKQTKLNTAPIRQTTDFIADVPGDVTYTVSPAAGFSGKSATAAPDLKTYREYTLSAPDRRPFSIVPADLDGDGEFDYVVRSSVTNIDPILYFNVKHTPHYFIEAFHRDGRRLWTKDLGDNVETGVWFTPFTAADLNGDGKAEIICKGSVEEDGIWKESEGLNKNKVMAGPEYILVLDGMTGKEIARAPWPDRRPYYQTGYYAHNYFARNMMAIFRPDGKTDCILALRGTYTFMQAEAWKLDNGKLISLWKYNNHDLGKNWWGQGSHNTRVADIDGDGRDEVILGAAVLDDDGSPLWTTGHGHPDYLFVGDITKKNPGFEVVTIYETRGNSGGFTCADAKTGKVLWELKKPHKHIHRGYCSDMDPRYRGWEVGGADSLQGGHFGPLAEYHWSPDGELLARDENAPYAKYHPFIPHFAYWDADLQREEIGLRMRDFRGGDCGDQLIDGRFLAQFDSDGDWREEIAVARRGGFRIYGTTIPAMDRRITLLEDEIYRKSILANSSGYHFDPGMGKLLTDDAVNLNLTILKAAPGTMEIVISAPLKQGVTGKLKVIPPGKVSFSRTQWDIKLSPAEIKTISVRFDNPEMIREYIRAEFSLDDGTVLRGQVPAASYIGKAKPIKLQGLIAEGENFKSQRGGKAVIRSDKKGVSGKCITHWDGQGHAITWAIKVPADGKYILQMRYCNHMAAERKLRCNGKDYGTVKIICSDAISGGEFPTDWKSIDLAELTLKKGVAEIELENIDGNSTNVDYLKLIPVKNNK